LKIILFFGCSNSTQRFDLQLDIYTNLM
jgi:hypothetical protein